MTDTIKARSIELCDAEGKTCVTLSAGREAVGLWITNRAGHTLAIYAEDDSAVIGVYAPGNGKACDAAISIDREGNVFLQRRHEDGTFSVRELESPVPA